MIKVVTFFIICATLPLTLYGSDYGTTGLIDIPSARMRDDGKLTTSTSWQSRTKSFAITYQITPWLEGTYRYTGFNDFFFWDRNFEFKARIIEEKDRIPEISFGIRDLTGTGFYGSEYLVASKKVGNFDLTLGIGWGRLAGDGDIKNPFTFVSDEFKRRKSFTGLGGEFSFETFFRGEEAGFFGGLSYKFPSNPLTFILEYNPDEYQREVGRGAPIPSSPMSVALKWDLSQATSMTLSHQNQDEWGLNLSAFFDTKSKPKRQAQAKFISSIDLPQNNLPSVLNKNSWYDMLLYDVERSGILLIEATVNQDSQVATIVMGNASYMIWADALATMINLADIHLPKFVKYLNVIIEEEGHRLQTINVSRQSIKFSQSRGLVQEEVRIQPYRELDFIQYKTSFVTKKIFFDYNLSFRTQLFDPDDPLRYQLFARIGMRTVLPNDWILRGNYAVDITHNFDESKRRSNSVLPHVRTDIVEYLIEGESGLDSLFLENRGNLQDNIYYRIYGGILEQMYSGLGGELLYHPFQSRISYGLSANFVKQRDYDRSFKHLDYKTTTAFASLYWASPFYNFDFAVHAGKYLAKDVGATLEVRRTFNNGWMVGIWATKTNVSAEDFGEGSFDKGMYFNVPFSTFFGPGDRASFKTNLRPIQRDGGQRLEDFSGNIWWDTRNARYDAFILTKTKKFLSGFSTKKRTSSQQNVLKKYYNEK